MSVELLHFVSRSATMKRTSVSEESNISGNKYDLVLACQPDFVGNYRFYNQIVELAESEKKMRLFSPHKDYNSSKRNSLEDSINFTIREAIPRTRGVLIHLSHLTPEMQKMWDSTIINRKPFLVFYPKEIKPIRESDFDKVKQLTNFRGMFQYTTEMGAIEYLRHNIENLIRGN